MMQDFGDSKYTPYCLCLFMVRNKFDYIMCSMKIVIFKNIGQMMPHIWKKVTENGVKSRVKWLNATFISTVLGNLEE